MNLVSLINILCLTLLSIYLYPALRTLRTYIHVHAFIRLFLFVCIYACIYWHLLIYICIYISLFLFIYIQILASSYSYMLAKCSTCHWITVVRYCILCSSCKSKLALMHCIFGKRCCHVQVFIGSSSVHHVMLNHCRCACSGIMRCSRRLRSASSQCWI